MHLTPFYWNLLGPPSGHGARVARDYGIGRELFSKFPGHYLGLHGLVGARSLLFHELPPTPHSILAFIEKPIVFMIIPVIISAIILVIAY